MVEFSWSILKPLLNYVSNHFVIEILKHMYHLHKKRLRWIPKNVHSSINLSILKYPVTSPPLCEVHYRDAPTTQGSHHVNASTWQLALRKAPSALPVLILTLHTHTPPHCRSITGPNWGVGWGGSSHTTPQATNGGHVESVEWNIVNLHTREILL